MVYCQFLYRSRILEALQAPTPAELQLTSEIRAQRYRFLAAFQVLFPIELAFVTVSKLFVLHRMQQFSLSASARSRALALSGRVFLGAVVVSNMAGVLSNAAAAVTFGRAAAFAEDAAASFASNNTAAGKSLEKQSVETVPAGLRTAAIQGLLECLVLVMIIAAFVAVGVSSHRIIASALRTLFTAQQRLESSAATVDHGRQLLAQAALQGKILQRKVVVTTVFLFLTILIRSAFRVLFAFATFFQNSSDACAASECDPCKNVYSHILYWLLYVTCLHRCNALTLYACTRPCCSNALFWLPPLSLCSSRCGACPA
jgi:hypothetical protein